jgi:hypothetical protein
MNNHMQIDTNRNQPTAEAIVELQQWFEGSRIRQWPSGRPTVLYHGTCAADFDTFHAMDLFGSGMFGKGINLTSSPADASKYASTDVMVNLDLGGKAYAAAMERAALKRGDFAQEDYLAAKESLTVGGGRIIPVIVSMKKPMEVGGWWYPNELKFNLAAAEIDMNRDEAKYLFEHLKRSKNGIEQFEWISKFKATKIYRQLATLSGCDGLIINAEVAPKANGAKHYLVLDSSQIRSAIEVAPLIKDAFPTPENMRAMEAQIEARKLIAEQLSNSQDEAKRRMPAP